MKMKKNRFFAALLCAMLLVTLLPTGALAAGGTVRIEGMALSAGTPYYYNGASGAVGTIQQYSTRDNDGTTHYNAYFDSANDTLHLYGLQAVSDQTGGVIRVSGLSTLYIELEDSTRNTVTCQADAADHFGIHAPSTKLVIYGDGKLAVDIVNPSSVGTGINADAIELQYPAELEVKASERATSVPVTAIATTSYDAKGGDDTNPRPTDGYNYADRATATGYRFITFDKLTDPPFPVWVNGIQINDSYINGKSVLGGTVTYTPARRATPAKLTLDGVTIRQGFTKGLYSAGVYAEDYPLRLYLKDANTIAILAPEDDRVTPCGVYSEKALTVEAESNARLTANITLTQGAATNPKPPCAMRANGGITLDGCAVISPDGGTISDDWLFISGSDGTTPLNNATIGPHTSVAFNGLAANGSDTESTTALTLTFDKDVAGLVANDITVTGATKGVLAKTGTGVYTLAISDVSVADGGTVNVAVAKTDFTFTPANLNTTVHKYTPPTEPAVTVSPASLDFGSFAAGSAPAAKVVTITNSAAANGTGFPLPSQTECIITAIEGFDNNNDALLSTVGSCAEFSVQPKASLAAGNYSIPIRIVFRNSTGVDIPVSFTVTSAPADSHGYTQYQITQGQNGAWVKGGGNGLRFTANGDYSKLANVWVDGYYVAPEYYTAVSGSTIVTLKASYLETLLAGRHTLRVSYTDGYAETEFTVNSAMNLALPKTGDASAPTLWLGVLLLAGAGLAASAAPRRKQES